MGEMTQEEIAKVAKTLRPAMISAMVTGNAYGTRVIGKMVTRNALRSRGLIDDASRWTALGWAVVLHVVSTEDAGWSPGHFKAPDDIHAEALREDAERFPVRYIESSTEHDNWSQDQAAMDLEITAPVPNSSGWQQIPHHPDGDIRCIETGVEVVRNIAGAWLVSVPMWQGTPSRPRKVMKLNTRADSKDDALHHANRFARPLMRKRIEADRRWAALVDKSRINRGEPVAALVNNGWEQIPDQREGNVRCIETGVEVRAHDLNGSCWEILSPEWQRSAGKVMCTDRIFTTKIEALGYATRSTRRAMRSVIAAAHAEALGSPLISGDTVPGFRGGKVPPGWSPEHSARLGRAIRSQTIAEPGSLVAAAEIVDRAVKRARYDALRAVLVEVDAWGGDAPVADDIRQLLNRAARKLGVRWP